MYHSWWFISLLVLFSTNLIVCSLERFPKTLRLIKTPLRPLEEKVIKTLPIKKELKFKTNLKTARDEIFNSLTASRYRVFETTEGDAIQLYSQKGKYTRFGVYVVHLSIILILVGAIISARFGFNGYVTLPEGVGKSHIDLRVPRMSQAEEFDRENIEYAIDSAHGDITLASKMLGMDKGVLTAKMKKYGIKPLGFSIKCNWYNTDYYFDTGAPKEFQSELVIFDGGKEVLTKVIEVNNPLTYKGITFYQSSYGMLPNVIDEFIFQAPSEVQGDIIRPKISRFPNSIGKFIITVTPEGGQERTLWLSRGETFEIAGSGIKGTIVSFSPALDKDRKTGVLGTNRFYKDTMINPAVAIEIDAPGMRKSLGWFLRGETTKIFRGSKHKIKFVDYWGIEYTGLQVSKDPGIDIIYFACIIMTLGLYAAFFMSHKKIWISLVPETSGKKGFVRVSVGGTASKNRLSFEREIDKIFNDVLGSRGKE